MKFYGTGIVWNGREDKPLCRFQNGEFETNDKETAEILLALGFEHTGKKPTAKPKETEATETIETTEVLDAALETTE